MERKFLRSSKKIQLEVSATRSMQPIGCMLKVECKRLQDIGVPQAQALRYTLNIKDTLGTLT
jgi:hypothetical protein